MVAAVEKLNLTLSGQVRIRGEVDARDFAGSTEPDIVFGERARLGLAASPTPDVTGFIQLQDARVWGEEQNTLNDAQADAFDLHQGYLEIRDLFVPCLDARAGRQEIALGEERLIGAVDWTQNARSLDGALVTYRWSDGGWVKPFWALLSEKDAIAAKGALKQADPNVDEGKDDDVWIAGIHAQQKLGDHAVEPHVYWLDDGTSDIELYTLGAYGNGKTPLGDDLALVYNATFDLQVGDVNGDDIQAYLGVIHGGVRTGPVTLTLGYEYLSGDDDTQDARRESFDTLLATNHKFYGEMDYFLNNAADTASLGLQDLVAKLRYKLTSSTALAADFHYFQTAVDDRTAGVTAEKRRFGGQSDLGEELDLWLTHAYNAYLDFRVGYSFFVPGEAMQARFEAQDAARGAAVESHGTMAHWAYLQANVVF
ncbi:MAG: alginate export family protein [Deltaproteobacteria bacterium]|nr:alginate export family protein [Deltaproteobacteria bacterium]